MVYCGFTREGFLAIAGMLGVGVFVVGTGFKHLVRAATCDCLEEHHE